MNRKMKKCGVGGMGVGLRTCLFQSNLNCGTLVAEHHSVRRLLLTQVHNTSISDSLTVTFSVDPGFK